MPNFEIKHAWRKPVEPLEYVLASTSNVYNIIRWLGADSMNIEVINDQPIEIRVGVAGDWTVSFNPGDILMSIPRDERKWGEAPIRVIHPSDFAKLYDTEEK